MPANFPTSPSVGQRHTISDKTWEWTGAVWDLVVSTNTLQLSGEDSTVITVNLTANEELRIVGDGANLSTTGSAGDSSNTTLQVSLNSDIYVDSIQSTGSTAVQINDGLNVSGTLSADTIDTNQLQSGDSTNIRVADNLVPAADDTYTLGTPDRRWQSLYVTGATIFLDETKLQIDNQGDFTVKDASDNLKRVIASELEVGTGANKIKIKKDTSTGKISFTDENDVPTAILHVVGDDSTGSDLFSGESIKIQGGDNVSVTVEEDSTRGFAVVKIDSNPTIAVDTITAGDSATTAFNSPVIFASSVKFDGDAQAITSILDEDTMSSNSATALATQQSIKAYVDTQTSAIVTTIGISDSSSNASTLTLGTNDLEFRAGNSITPTVAGTGVTFALNDTIVVNAISSADSTAVRINDAIETDGATINGNLSVSGNTTIDGNLTVAGTTTYIETTNTKVSDPLLLLNNGNSGGSDIDAGIMIERGSAGNNAVFYWNEGDDVFKAVTTTSGEDASAITDTALANVRVAEPTDNSDAATKNYVDTATASIVTSIGISDSASNASTLTLGTNDLEFRAGNSITPTVAGTGVTFALNDAIAVDDITAKDSSAININSPIQVTGNINTDTALTIAGTTVNAILDEDNLSSNSDTALATQQSIKAYVDASVVGGVGNLVGTNITLGSPTDSSTYPVGAISTLTSSHSLTDSIDDLNEALENVRNNTFVKSVDFTADNSVGGAGLVVTLTITTVGNPTRYDITWGDGDTTIGTTDSTPTHTYATNSGSPFDVTVRAYNHSGEGTGSEATETKSNFITIYTANPSVAYEMYAASSGGSAITKCDLGSTVYMKNVTTNTTGVTATFSMDWGDGVTETITANSNAGGVDGARLSHTYDRPDAGDSSTTMVGDGDMRFSPRLTLLSHSTANPTEVPKSSSTSYFYVYAEHDPLISVDGSSIRGVNEEGTSGFPVTFNNDTISRPGAYSTFNTNSGSNTYTWNFGEGAGNITVNIGSGSAGDTGVDRSNTFNLSSGEQSGGTTQTYTTTLSINNGHSNSPFSTNLNIIVEPDVRANIAGTADTVSTGSSDNQYTLYDHTDLDGNNRASVTFTNTSQNNDDNEYDFFNDSSDVLTVTEASAGAGSTSATLTKNFTGTSNGAFTTDFKVTGTPDTIHQTDSETVTFTMKAVPSAPANLSTKSITMSDSAQGTNPHLCASADDNTGSFTSLNAGDSCETSTVRRYTTTSTIDTSTASNFFNGASGTLSAVINGSADGAKTFTSAENETGTFTSLVVTSNVDYDTVDSSYPQRFYLVASAKITKNLSAYTVGVNAQRLEHDATGNTNLVYVVKDDITSTPTTTIGTVAEGTQGSLRYISGVPYYNTGSPTLTVTGTTVANFTGQCYQDTSSPHEVDNGTQVTGSGNVITNANFTYANVDGASTMLSGGIPIADTGVSSAYTLGAVTVNVNSSSVFSRRKIQARSTNANGTGSYNQSDTIISVFTASPTGLNNELGGIAVSDSLGAGFDDDAVRIADFLASTTDTPSFNGATNFYTNNTFSGAESVSGTREATVIPSSTSAGTISHDVTDYSTGYLPAGPDRSGDTGTQYYTMAFRRTTMSNFDLTLTGTVSGVFIAAPGTAIDSASSLNGWLDASTTYGGSGVPGADTGNGGNGSNGCAFTSGDRIIDGTSYSGQTFTLTLGTENGTNATGNVVLIRFKLNSGDSLTAVSIA